MNADTIAIFCCGMAAGAYALCVLGLLALSLAPREMPVVSPVVDDEDDDWDDEDEWMVSEYLLRQTGHQ